MKKSMRFLFIIQADLESLFEKISACYNNPKKSSTIKKNKHRASGYSLFTHCSFDITKIKLDYYKDKDCMKNFSKDLKEHATKIMNYEKKRNDTANLSRKQVYEKQKVFYIRKKEFNTDKNNGNAFKLYHKVRDRCHYTGKYRGTALVI